ncbi:MAG TPA: hypothetical protein VLL54_14700 [Pyrinomonadaceae bacterium]|nr:hypothetical protein [Pyrinomonadaceae bacterium]
MKQRLTTILFVFVAVLLGGAPKSYARSLPAATLSEAQIQAIKRVRAASARKAILPGLRLARITRQIYDNMLAPKPDEKLRLKLSAELKETTWELLTIKGQSIRESVNALTPAQKNVLKVEMHKPGAPADLGELLDKTFGLDKEQ